VFVVERADDETSLHVVRGVVDEVFPGGVAVGKNQRQTQLRIVPRLAELAQGQGCRVFQYVTVVEIAKELFKLWHIEVDPRLHPEPLKREYCTQVNESEFAFLSRILAEEGAHFHIEHGKYKSVVVLVNDPRGYGPIAGKEKLAYRDAGGAVTVDHVKSIRRERRVRPGSAAYRDYNDTVQGHHARGVRRSRAPDPADSAKRRASRAGVRRAWSRGRGAAVGR
jgi:uncharacterized protein involved in type VI secretion and phage assembly